MTRKKHMQPARLIALCFLGIILVGAILLSLPISHNEGESVTPFQALFTATSATCVTGLIVVDTAETFSVFGRTVILALIQIGGLGAATIGIGVTLLAGKRMSVYDRNVLQESWNLNSTYRTRRIYRNVLLITASIEIVGALVLIPIFSEFYPLNEAIGISFFHSISSFNNAGFDLMGNNMSGLTSFNNHIPLNLITALLIICGGLGYLVYMDMWGRRKEGFRRFKLQTKIVLTMTVALIFVGMFLLVLSDDISPLEAFFQSVSARTAGFSTINLAELSSAGILVMCILMLIGASPGSTGGGIKTTTIFAVLTATYSSATRKKREIFSRKIVEEDVSKAFTVLLMAVSIIILVTFLLMVFEPEIPFEALLFEAVSAFATVGLSAGVTPILSDESLFVIILTMYVGRLGPLTIATVWFFRDESEVSCTSENITIG